MKQHFLLAVLLTVNLASCFRDPHSHPPGKGPEVVNNPNHPMKNGLQNIIDKYIAKGIPGIQVSVNDSNGWYSGSAWLNSQEGNKPIGADSTTWIFSITKTFTAALIMQYREKGQIDLDKPIARYLPDTIAQKITRSDQITVRMLLNHSSGIVNFIELDAYRERQFTDPLHQPNLTEILAMVDGKELMFNPGSESYYSNTNYLLLQVILEKISNKPYGALLQAQIIQPLKLKHTFFNLPSATVAALGFPVYYLDPNGDGQLQSCSPWNNALGNASGGWGGIAARPTDVIQFYQALIQGKIVSNSSLVEMQQFKNDYGLGLESYEYPQGFAVQFGHEGDGVGNSTMILYIPARHAFVFINATAGRQLPGPFVATITELKNELCGYVVNFKR